MANVEERIAQLEKRIEALEAEREILRTLHQYGHAWDYGPDETRLDCFTDDGSFRVAPQPLVDIQPFECNGKQEMWDKWISHHVHAPDNYFKHLMIEPKITLLSDTEATVHSMLGMWFHRDGTPYLAGYGRYIDHMVKCPDGRWRLKDRTAELEAQEFPPGGWGTRNPPPPYPGT
jgi:hypothetical protein